MQQVLVASLLPFLLQRYVQPLELLRSLLPLLLSTAANTAAATAAGTAAVQ